jgi:hypothetical protein
MKKLNFIILLLLCAFFNSAFSINDNKYVLDKIYNDKVYYNVFSNDDKVYFSTNKGIFSILAGDQVIQYDLKKRGPVDKNFNSIALNIRFIEPPITINNQYEKSTTDFLYFNEYIYIVSKGHLLIYKSNFYTFTPFASVRTISENFTGTYGGIFYNDKKINSLTYTDGQIKEFDSIAFVCYNGLLYLNGIDEIFIYKNNNEYESSKIIGNVRNIFYLNNQHFLVISDKGIFKLNLLSKDFETLYLKKESIVTVRKNFRGGHEFDEKFLFVDGIFLKSIDVKRNTVKTVHRFNHLIVDIVASGNLIYALTEKSNVCIVDYNLYDIEKTITIDKIELDINYHTIDKSFNYLILSGNNDLAIYDLKENLFYPEIIIDEFNKNAIYKTDLSLSIGSIHGVYKFRNIDKFIGLLNYKNLQNQYDTEHFKYIVISIILLLTLFFYYKHKLNRNVIFTSEKLVEEIKKYINNNLSTVTVSSVQSKFNLEHAAIYHLSSNFKPGEYIKLRREEKAFQLIKNNKSNTEIAKITGYSESYIKKNKSKLSIDKTL